MFLAMLTLFIDSVSSDLKYMANSRQYRVVPSATNWLALIGSLGSKEDLQLFRIPVLFIRTKPSI